MLSFAKNIYTYRKEIKKQSKWINKYANLKNYDTNPNKMVSTNLKIWLTEMEAIYGKRLCPCFDPSGIQERDKKMHCPCVYVDDEIEKYGSCHCALFGKKGMPKKEWSESSKRLMKEYRIPLKINNNILDTRGMPLDSYRGLPIPDASHQLNAALLKIKTKNLKMIVASEQEAQNLKKIAGFKRYTYDVKKEQDYFEVDLGIK